MLQAAFLRCMYRFLSSALLICQGPAQEPIPQLRHSYIRHEALAAALAAEPPARPGAPSRPALRHLVAVASAESERDVLVPGTVAPDPHK